MDDRLIDALPQKEDSFEATIRPTSLAEYNGLISLPRHFVHHTLPL